MGPACRLYPRYGSCSRTSEQIRHVTSKVDAMRDDNRSFRKAFDLVRQVYFPRWDRKRLWRVRSAKNLNGAVGYCDFTGKLIKAASILENDDELTALLIHEIAHAATASYHTKRWLTRMEKAAQRAKRVGRSNLARLIRKDLNGYKDASISTSASK
jgi:hypothetical protein